MGDTVKSTECTFDTASLYRRDGKKNAGEAEGSGIDLIFVASDPGWTCSFIEGAGRKTELCLTAADNS